MCFKTQDGRERGGRRLQNTGGIALQSKEVHLSTDDGVVDPYGHILCRDNERRLTICGDQVDFQLAYIDTQDEIPHGETAKRPEFDGEIDFRLTLESADIKGNRSVGVGRQTPDESR